MKHFKPTIICVIVLVVGILISETIQYKSQKNIQSIVCTVTDTQQQQLISGSKDNVNTEIRYLVITDKGTFTCKKSMFNGVYDASNIFFHLQKGKRYKITVAGYGKGLFFDYPNIIKVE